MEVGAIMECWDESRMVGCLLILTCSRLDGCLGFSEGQRVEANDTQTCLLYICWTHKALSQSAVKLHHHHTDEAVVDTQNSCGEGSPCPNKKTTSTKAKP